MAEILFITGTDTGVGKTVLTVGLTRHLRAMGTRVRAVKPFCSGGRGDARLIRAAQGGEVALDEINPWHFAAPLAPLLAARREGKGVRKREALAYLRKMGRQCDVLVIEGAGGLLSPLGEDFSARELIGALRARAVVVCPNRLGAVNQVRLTLEALDPTARRGAVVVLMSGRRGAAIQDSNFKLLGEFHPPGQIHKMPWLVGRREWRGWGRLIDRIDGVSRVGLR